MAEPRDFSKSKQIRILAYVLCAGVLFASFLVFTMLHYYNREGAYSAANVLLSPETLAAFSGQKKEKLTLDRLELSIYDESDHRRKTIPVSQEFYFHFYALVKNDSSVKRGREDRVFFSNRYASLTIYLENKGSKLEDERKIITEVDISEDDNYRVLLRHHGSETSWAYFHHSGIYKAVINYEKQ